ncbi:MAG: CDP-diacylglycerol--glycerol-3-phosphate 3-phosphatidyltransferase [Candidatus Kapaibacterium sp.]
MRNVPNILSVIRILLSPVFLIMFLSGDVFLQRVSLGVFFAAVLTDWYDGWHARKYDSITNFGIFMDPLADKVLTSFAFYLFYLLGFMPLWMLIIIALRDIIVTLIRSYDEYKGITLKTSFIAKAKTFMQMSYIFLILFLLILITSDIDTKLKEDIRFFIYESNLNYFLMLFVTLLTLYTGLDYIIRAQYYKRNETD